MIESGMDNSRIAKLVALTHGVALVSSLTTTACDRQSGESTQPPMQPAINAPPTQDPGSRPASGDPAAASASATTDDTQTAPTRTVPVRRFPIPNAMPGRPVPRDQGDSGP
jgi:hypothetical protein